MVKSVRHSGHVTFALGCHNTRNFCSPPVCDCNELLLIYNKLNGRRCVHNRGEVKNGLL